MVALQSLYARGAYFVLCQTDKAPVKGISWKQRPALEVVENHVNDGGLIGRIPYSVGTSALDVDAGNPDELLEQHPHRAAIPSRQRGRFHLYYDDDEGHGNRTWKAFGCKGEVRSKSGYLILHDDAPERLVTALQAPGNYPYTPIDLFEAAGAPLRAEHALLGGGPTRWSAPILELVQVGARHDSLFDLVRHKAYEFKPGPDHRAWRQRVIAYAKENNRRFPTPLPHDEVENIGHHVARHTWKNRHRYRPRDHSSAAQFRRNKRSVVARSMRNKSRDSAIRQRFIAGESVRQIAAALNLPKSTVGDVVRSFRASAQTPDLRIPEPTTSSR